MAKTDVFGIVLAGMIVIGTIAVAVSGDAQAPQADSCKDEMIAALRNAAASNDLAQQEIYLNQATAYEGLYDANQVC